MPPPVTATTFTPGPPPPANAQVPAPQSYGGNCKDSDQVFSFYAKLHMIILLLTRSTHFSFFM